MAIAQHLVAGEVGVRPSANESSEPTDSTVVHHCDTRNLPYQTLRAHQRALSMITLPKRARSALAALAQTVDCRKPLASIFAHRDYLSARAGLSERTWYRAEQDLIDAQLITVTDQERKSGVVTVTGKGRKTRGGLFGAAYIHLTRTAAEALGLIATETPKAADGDAPARKAAVEAGGAEEQENGAGSASADSLIPPYAKEADRFTYKVYLSPTAFQKRQPGDLPEDLKRLLTVGFRKNYIFKLMRLAREQYAKRLSDVVEACWEQIRAARRPISYLLALLASSTDFAWLAKQRTDKTQAKRDEANRAAKQDALRSHVASGTFYDPSAETRYEVSADGESVSVRSTRETAVRTAGTGWISWFAEGLKSGSIVPRSDTLDERFEQALQAHQHPAARPAAVQSQHKRSELVLANWDTLRGMVGLRPRALAA